MTIEERIKNAQKRNERTLNLSFTIAGVYRLCERFDIDPTKKEVADLVSAIGHELLKDRH